jgi:hypothetical protein
MSGWSEAGATPVNSPPPRLPQRALGPPDAGMVLAASQLGGVVHERRRQLSRAHSWGNTGFPCKILFCPRWRRSFWIRDYEASRLMHTGAEVRRLTTWSTSLGGILKADESSLVTGVSRAGKGADKGEADGRPLWTMGLGYASGLYLPWNSCSSPFSDLLCLSLRVLHSRTTELMRLMLT